MADHSARSRHVVLSSALAVAVLNGIIEQKRGAGLNGKLAQEATHLNSV